MERLYSQLQINGLPVHYQVLFYKDAYLFDPVIHPHPNLEAPFFSVREIDGALYFKGLDDASVQDQVADEIAAHAQFRLVCK